MPTNGSTGVAAIVFKRTASGVKFLLLYRVLHWRGWEFAKGHADPGESMQEALLRELREETGLGDNDVVCAKPTGLKLCFTGLGGEQRSLEAFLVEVGHKARASLAGNYCKEHSTVRWVSTARALELLYWDNSRELFKAVAKLV